MSSAQLALSGEGDVAPKLFGYLDTLVTGLPDLLSTRLSARLGGLGDSKSYCGAKNASSRHRESEKRKNLS